MPRQQKTTETRQDYVKAARAYCARKYSELREEENCHPSHTACKAMRLTEKRFVDLGTFGTEGISSECGRSGLTYLNTGDTYELTILFNSDSERFSVGSWGDWIEDAERTGFVAQ